MRILVTGGAGYIGSVLTPLLLARGHHVRVFDSLVSGGLGILGCCTSRRFEFVHGDIGDETALAAALDGADAIVHLAAVVGYPACDQAPDRAVKTNVNGTKLLMALRARHQRLVLASTGSVYGSLPHGVCVETTPCAPLTLYGASKLDAERLVLDGDNCVVYRFATAFGPSPSMRFDLLPNNFVRQAVQEGRLAIYESDYRRTFIHVTDIARSVLFAFERWAELHDDVYNVGSEGLNCTKVELARQIQARVDCELAFDEFASDADQRNYEVSYEKIRRKGFSVQRTLDHGIAELITAARLTSTAEVGR